MPNILDNTQYPMYLKEAQDLHMQLVRLYPTTAEASTLAAMAGIQPYEINQAAKVYVLWMEILQFAAPRGMIRGIVKNAYDRLPDTSPSKVFFKALLDDTPPVLDAEPRGAQGAPKFISGDDSIMENESLLYRDDLTLASGRVPALIKTLQILTTLAPSVCRMIVDINGFMQHGTGFRIGDDMLLTNWHVIHRESDGRHATAITAEFNYEEDGAGTPVPSSLIKCDATNTVFNQVSDWGLVRTVQPIDPSFPSLKLSEAIAPENNSAAFIIQHPLGNLKRIGFIRNQVSKFDDNVVHYLTDTQEGSSGSPVFDSAGKLFALHHAGGRPQEVLGKPPMVKNEGIRITKVRSELTALGIIFP